MTGLAFAHGQNDPRFYDIDDDFRQVLADLAPMVAASRMTKARFFHRLSTTASGTLTLHDQLDLPAHDFFAPGRPFEVVARYSNGVEADDIAPAIRGVTLRLYDPFDPKPLLDLSLNTGECFFVRTAEIFRRIALGQSERLAAEIDGFRDNAWGLYRHASSYTRYHYYSQAPSGFIAADGTQWLARYRLVPADGTPDTGRVDPGGLLLPPESPGLSRDPADRRSRTFLHDELRAKVLNSPVRGLLQVQLHPVTRSAAEESVANNEVALDCTRPWTLPWRDLAVLELDSLVSNRLIEPMRFSQRVAPADLGPVLARSPHENASLNHLRALMYEWTSAVRQGEQPKGELAHLLGTLPRPTPKVSTVDIGSRRTVAVVGAGPAGLTVARELERAGHRVVVLERQDEVGGKCESVDIDGHAYDLGGHLCTTQYENVARLAVELGVPTEDTTPHRVYDIGTGEAAPQSEAFFERGSFSRYAELRETRFPHIAEAGLAHSAKALAQPVTEWLAEHGLESLATSLGTGYTAAGYGYLTDELPALYFVKYAEMTGLLSARPELLGHTGSFTITGGFASLWQKVAAELSDVRCGVTITSIVRVPDLADGGVRVETDQGTVIADDLVLTVPIDQLLPILDASEEERDLARRVRFFDYRTTIASVEDLPRSAFYLVDEHCRPGAEPGLSVSFHHRYPGRDTYAVYSYGEPEFSDVGRMGGRLGEVHTQRQWKFMPHFSSEDISEGVYERIDELQGARHTFHAGSLPAFELVECNVAYARKLVRDHFGGAAEPAREPAAQSSIVSSVDRATLSAEALRDWLVEHIAEELRMPRDTIDPGARLDTFALESISVAAVQAGLTDLLGFRVPHTLFLHSPTIDAIAGRLAADPEPGTRAQDPAGEPDLLLNLSPARPFFCVGGAVGAAYYLWKLARETGSARPFYGVRAPGHDGVTEPAETVEELAARCLEQIRLVQPDGPYLLGGHSFGGLVAYEMGRQLRAAGQEVERIVLLDTYIPEPGQEPPLADDAAALEELLAINAHASAHDGPVERVDPGAGVAERMGQFARFLGATGATGVEEYIGAMLRVFQANLAANATFQPGPSDLDVVLFKACDGFPPVMRPDRNTALKLADPANGWEHVELGSLSVVDVSGDHFTMFAGESGASLARAVRDCLAG